MKKISKVVSACILMLTFFQNTKAETTFPFLTFLTQNGNSTTMSVTSLSMTVSGSTLSVTNAEETKSFQLADLVKMYFSNSSTGISDISSDTESQKVDVYTMNGIHVGQFASQTEAMKALTKGVYIIKSNKKSIQVAVQ